MMLLSPLLTSSYMGARRISPSMEENGAIKAKLR
jgi:hypothetical protein